MQRKYEARNNAAHALYTYVNRSLKHRDITLDYEKTMDLLHKLLLAQMQVPKCYQTDKNGKPKVENLTDEKILKCVTSIRDHCRTKIILVWQIMEIMPPHVRQRVTKRFQDFVLYYAREGCVKQIEL